MAAATHCQLGARLAGVVDNRHDVRRTLHTRDGDRTAIEHAVPDAARLVVVGVLWRDQLASELLGQGLQRSGLFDGRHAFLLSDR